MTGYLLTQGVSVSEQVDVVQLDLTGTTVMGKLAQAIRYADRAGDHALLYAWDLLGAARPLAPQGLGRASAARTALLADPRITDALRVYLDVDQALELAGALTDAAHEVADQVAQLAALHRRGGSL